MASFSSNSKLFVLILLLLYGFVSCKKPENNLQRPSISDTSEIITSLLYPVSKKVGSAIDGYYIGLPSNYLQSTNSYPVLIFIPGAGQFGNGSIDLPLLLQDGPAELIDEKKFPGTFKVNNKSFSLIVFTPQLKWYPSTYNIKECIEFVKSTYRVDTTRIYLSGLSMGGVLSCDVASEVPSEIAAIVPMAGVSVDYLTNNKCQEIANNNLPVWAFHSNDDPLVDITNVKGFISKINSFSPTVPSKLTVWPNGGHDAWTRAVNPSFKENGLNIYEWMLQYHK